MRILAALAVVVTVTFVAAPAPASTPRPQVRSLSVTSGPAAGGTRVIVRGRNFTRHSWVLFGGLPGRTSYRSSRKLVATSPAHVAGPVAVVVRSGRRSSRATRHGRFTYVAAPVAPVAPKPVVWAQVALGGDHACAIKTDGSLWCWGDNWYDQLGSTVNTGTDVANPVPLRVGTDASWTSVDVGYSSSCGIRADHSLWCWGGNFDGQLGDPANTDFKTPTPGRVGGGATWRAVSVGFRHACAIRTDGTLWCWGADGSGQLGNGTTATSVSTPTQVGTAASWASVGTGDFHTCASRTDGTVWCWGANNMGQLGNTTDIGTATPHPTPSQVGTATDWKALGVGSDHTCATKAAGTLWCWGWNFGGAVVTQVGTDATWRSVSSGDYHGCGTTAAGALSCWGLNDTGQLGRGTADSTFDGPAQVGTPTWTQTDTGYRNSCGVKSDGSLWCWGWNSSGELGSTANNGTDNPNPTPIQVLS